MGYIIVDASRVLQERLSIPFLSSPASVTVKSTEERPDDLLVFAYPWSHGEQVEKALVGELRHVAVRRSRYGNNTVVAVRVERDGECRILLPDGRSAADRGGLCDRGPGVRIATVIHDPPGGGRPVVSPEIRVVGYYAILQWPGEGVSYSEHIRGPDLLADLLLAAEEVVDLKQYHVHFRSNSRIAEPERVRAELEQLLRELEEIRGLQPGEPRVIRLGEYLSLIRVPRPAKDLLDAERSKASPTVRWHHSLKTFGRQESTLVDCAEYAAKAVGDPQPRDGSLIAAFLLEHSPRGQAVIDHLRPDGSSIRLGPFRVESVLAVDGEVRARLSREIRGAGVYDGLGAEKMPGDRAVTTLSTDSWVVIHEYYRRDGRLVGVYANINTPPEIGMGRIKYLDLYVDVVKRPGSPASIIDLEELEDARDRGIVSEALYEEAVRVAEKTARRLDSMY